MQAGRLRHSVIIQQPSYGAEGTYGGKILTWSTFATVNAAIVPMRGNKLFSAQSAQSKVDTEIYIRYLSGVTASMRVVFGSTYYDINAVIDKEMRGVEMLLMCSTGVNEG